MRTALKIAQPADPVLEDIMDRLFEGKQSKDFGDLVKRFARLALNREGEWVDRDFFIADLILMLEYARDCVEESQAEDRKNDYHKESGAL